MPETFAFAWALAKWLGIPIILISFLTAWKVKLLEVNLDSISEPYKSVMYFISIVSLSAIAWERYQKGGKIQEERRKIKIENDHQEWKNEKEKESVN